MKGKTMVAQELEKLGPEEKTMDLKASPEKPPSTLLVRGCILPDIIEHKSEASATSSQ